MQIIARHVLKEVVDDEVLIEKILLSRGITTGERESFLHPTIKSNQDLITQFQIDTGAIPHAKELLLDAINKKLKICVFGDYDADGITATATMWQTLKIMGAHVLPFIPNRKKHGYGLSKAAVDEILSGQAFAPKAKGFVPDLIITVDNGIVANEEIKRLKDANKVVIITDHHQIGINLPEADVIIHTTLTSGAGIAWIISRFLLSEQDSIDLIDLATIGIIADQMPLTKQNRAIVKKGLEVITKTKNLGLRKILDKAGLIGKSITTYDVNYLIAPRINAVGRIDDAKDGLRLLCTHNQSQAEDLSERMEALNKQRQIMTDDAVKDAISQITKDNITVLASDNYHHGVIGLIASKLVEASSKPAVVMSIDEDVVKGSARSVVGVNITTILRSLSHLLLGVGGHEQAAGFSLKKSNLPEFTAKLKQIANEQIDASLLIPTIQVDVEITLAQTTLSLAQKLMQLEPYGLGNLKPRFVSSDLEIVSRTQLGQSGKHSKLLIKSGNTTRTLLWFNSASLQKKIAKLVYTLDINSWQNKQELQLIASYVEFTN